MCPVRALRALPSWGSQEALTEELLEGEGGVGGEVEQDMSPHRPDPEGVALPTSKATEDGQGNFWA